MRKVAIISILAIGALAVLGTVASGNERPLEHYDTDADGEFSWAEARAAAQDYFSGSLSREQMLDVQLLYTFILPVPTRVEALEPLYPVDGFGDQPVSASGKLLVLDNTGHHIRFWDANGNRYSSSDIPILDHNIEGVTVGANRIYLADNSPTLETSGYNRWVRVYTLTGERRDSEDMSHRTNTNNHGIAFLNGRIRMVHNANLTGYWPRNHRLLSFSPSGELRREEILELGFADNGQASLTGLTITPTRIVAVDNTSGYVRFWDHSGTRQPSEDFSIGAAEGRWEAIASVDGYLYVLDDRPGDDDARIKVWTETGIRKANLDISTGLTGNVTGLSYTTSF